jgi:hypothetical protein
MAAPRGHNPRNMMKARIKLPVLLERLERMAGVLSIISDWTRENRMINYFTTQ